MKKEKLSVRDLCITALFAAVTAICAQIAIPIPFSPVPISFGSVHGVYFPASPLRGALTGLLSCTWCCGASCIWRV